MLLGKKAIVTGGSRGIGRAIALEFASQGADIAVIYYGDEKAAEQTCLLAREMGVQAQSYKCDVSQPAQVSDTVGAIYGSMGSVEILVNNAGVTSDGLIAQMDDEAFDRVISVNLKGAFYMTRQVYRQFMRARYGRIINITSVSGLMGNPGQANYSAAKAGLVGLTKTTAKELAGRGVTCNAIAPGFIQTDMTSLLPPAALEAAVSRIPQRRIGLAEDVAYAAAFLADDRAGYITGEIIRVDGGLYI